MTEPETETLAMLKQIAERLARIEVFLWSEARKAIDKPWSKAEADLLAKTFRAAAMSFMEIAVATAKMEQRCRTYQQH